MCGGGGGVGGGGGGGRVGGGGCRIHTKLRSLKWKFQTRDTLTNSVVLSLVLNVFGEKMFQTSNSDLCREVTYNIIVRTYTIPCPRASPSCSGWYMNSVSRTTMVYLFNILTVYKIDA